MRHPIGEAVCLCERVMMADDEARRGIELDSTSEMGRMAMRRRACNHVVVQCHVISEDGGGRAGIRSDWLAALFGYLQSSV